MELAGSVIELVKLTFGPIRKCWKNHRGIVQYKEILDEKMEELNCRKEDRELRVKAELLPGKKLKKEVELWFAKVEKLNLEVKSTEQKISNVKYFHRAHLGRELLKKIQEVDELYRKGVFHEGLVEALPELGDMLPATSLGETTSKRKLEEIWACLMSDEVRKIGVYGMGGIGKTMTMKHINNRVLGDKKKFDSVIWVTVSKASSVFKLQDAIALKLGFDISRYEDETTRAGKLHALLAMKTRYVLILDDLWEVYRLEDVGIPEPSSENGCKLVLTSRSFEVCRGMSCKNIRMELLTNQEAWDLFASTIGHDVLCNPDLEPIAAEFVKECGRLPLAIITVAGSLKGVDDYYEWKTSLEDLKAYAKGGNMVLEQLKFSYVRLANKNLQDCLLYCALYPEDARIYREELIEYLIDEGIIEGTRSRKAGFERGHAILNKLEYACLLEGSVSDDNVKYVKVHDLVRDMVIQITSSNPKFMVEAGVALKGIPSEGKWAEDLIRVSLTRNNISNIPLTASPMCPGLLTLMLNYNKLTCIPDCFFVHMKSLNVLDLSYTSIEDLPKSVSDLINLAALLLRRCQNLKYVPSLANLKALRRLDLSFTNIEELPAGMELLANLRYLNLDTANLEILPDGILPKLSQLQYLVLCDSFSRNLTIRGDELASLEKLENFRGQFYDINNFNTYVRSMKEGRDTNYTMGVGFEFYAYGSLHLQYKKAVILSRCDAGKSFQQDQDPLVLPQDVELLSIGECGIIKSLCTAAHLGNATNLRTCAITNCESIKCVLSSSSCTAPLLQSLECLHLANLKELHWLVKEARGAFLPLPPGTFSSLRHISIEFCPKLKNLFTLSTLFSSIQNLEELCVKCCGQMSSIINTDLNQNDGERNTPTIITFPKLRVLELWNLPILNNICNNIESMLATAVELEEVSIWNCPNLRNIPFLDREPHPQSVRKIDVHKRWWDSLEWKHPGSKDALQPLCKFWAHD